MESTTDINYRLHIQALRQAKNETNNAYEINSIYPPTDTEKENGSRVTIIVPAPVHIAQEKKVIEVKLTHTPDVGDYYYYYVQNGVGKVTVPKNAPEGTLVLTYPMDGCAIAVYYDPNTDELIFCHDADAKAINIIGLKNLNLVNKQRLFYLSTLEKPYNKLREIIIKDKPQQVTSNTTKRLLTINTHMIAVAEGKGRWGVHAHTIYKYKLYQTQNDTAVGYPRTIHDIEYHSIPTNL